MQGRRPGARMWVLVQTGARKMLAAENVYSDGWRCGSAVEKLAY